MRCDGAGYEAVSAVWNSGGSSCESGEGEMRLQWGKPGQHHFPLSNGVADLFPPFHHFLHLPVHLRRITSLVVCLCAPPCALQPPWWYHRALAPHPREHLQLRQDDLPQVLRPSPSPCDQLQEALLRSLLAGQSTSPFLSRLEGGSTGGP
jgi:hypothetical protein